ncbi:MAG: hypothetical protein KJP23_20905 [Deltaproteobacteria bacterium]|nr:hypothetical protein [Deltaproteobacteria bacterium]
MIPVLLSSRGGPTLNQPHLKIMIDKSDSIKSLNPLNVNADLCMIGDSGTIAIKADGSSIFVSFSSLRVAYTFLRIFLGFNNFPDILRAVDRAFKQMDITLFWQSKHVGILGSKGKPIFVWVLLLVQKFIRPLN